MLRVPGITDLLWRLTLVFFFLRMVQLDLIIRRLYYYTSRSTRSNSAPFLNAAFHSHYSRFCQANLQRMSALSITLSLDILIQMSQEKLRKILQFANLNSDDILIESVGNFFMMIRSIVSSMDFTVWVVEMVELPEKLSSLPDAKVIAIARIFVSSSQVVYVAFTGIGIESDEELVRKAKTLSEGLDNIEFIVGNLVNPSVDLSQATVL